MEGLPLPRPLLIPDLGLFLALCLPLRPGLGTNPTALDSSIKKNSTIIPSIPGSNGALSQEAITAIIVVFSILAALLLAVGLALLVHKLWEKCQMEGTNWPSSEEQFSHAA
ncbi:protein crumbs homolog 3-like [Cynocephalus volans]|uniref:protein crumbs homolog 3-like n=1 Tax=Cynocephalus volans TaxID=110931 RepID=UPI002FC9EED5